MKTLPVNSVFTSWVNVFKKVAIVFRSAKSLKGIFFLCSSKVEIFSTKLVFLCLLAFVTLFQSSIGFVFDSKLTQNWHRSWAHFIKLNLISSKL